MLSKAAKHLGQWTKPAHVEKFILHFMTTGADYYGKRTGFYYQEPLLYAALADDKQGPSLAASLLATPTAQLTAQQCKLGLLTSESLRAALQQYGATQVMPPALQDWLAVKLRPVTITNAISEGLLYVVEQLLRGRERMRDDTLLALVQLKQDGGLYRHHVLEEELRAAAREQRAAEDTERVNRRAATAAEEGSAGEAGRAPPPPKRADTRRAAREADVASRKRVHMDLGAGELAKQLQGLQESADSVARLKLEMDALQDGARKKMRMEPSADVTVDKLTTYLKNKGIKGVSGKNKKKLLEMVNSA